MELCSLFRHRLYIHYPVVGHVCEQASKLSLADWAGICGAVLPQNYKDVLAEHGATIPIWERASPADARKRVSDDLIPQVRHLLNAERPELARRWRLSDEALRLLSNGDLASTSSLSDHREMIVPALKLRESAIKRLQGSGISAGLLKVKLDNVELAWFASGVAFLIASVVLERLDDSPLSLFELQEAVHAFSRFNSCCWKPRLSDAPLDDTKFSIGQIVRSLIEPSWPRNVESDRAMTYCYAQLSEHAEPSDLDRLAAFLARHYTSDYAFEPQEAQVTTLKEFANLRHALTREGIASLACPPRDGDMPQFLQDWHSRSLERAYLPLALVLLHEDSFLSSLLGRATASRGEEDDLEIFDQVINDALLLRLDFRWSYVSAISMHNAFVDAFRAALSLDSRLGVLTEDVNAMAERLQSARAAVDRQEREQRDFSLYTFGIWSTAALTGLTSFTIVKEVHDVWVASVGETLQEVVIKWLRVFAAAPGETPHEMVIKWLPVMVGTFFAFVSVWIGYRYRPRRPRGGKLQRISLRGMRLQMIRRARR